MARRGKKTIYFDFDYKYPDKNGKFATSREIDIEAPGRKFIEFHNNMEATLAQAEFGAMSRVTSMGSVDMGEIMRSLGDDIEQARAESEAAKANRSGADYLKVLKDGLKSEEYAKTFDYIMVHLTNKPMCKIGNTDVRVPDGVWDNIFEAGGMDAFKQVVGEYLLFFVDMPMQKQPKETQLPASNGTVSLPISV